MFNDRRVIQTSCAWCASVTLQVKGVAVSRKPRQWVVACNLVSVKRLWLMHFWVQSCYIKCNIRPLCETASEASLVLGQTRSLVKYLMIHSSLPARGAAAKVVESLGLRKSSFALTKSFSLLMHVSARHSQTSRPPVRALMRASLCL